MPTAATATPYKPACDVASRVTTTTMITGASVLIMPRAKSTNDDDAGAALGRGRQRLRRTVGIGGEVFSEVTDQHATDQAAKRCDDHADAIVAEGQA